MYGILCATPEELSALAERLHLRPEARSHGPTRVWTGVRRGAEIALAQAGIGKVNAAAAATLLLDRFEAERLIFSGVAGGLDPDLPVGTVLFAERLAIHDYGIVSGGKLTATAYGVIPVGAPPLTELLPAQAEVVRHFHALAERVRPQLEGPVRLGGVVTGDYFLNCAQTRGELRANLRAEAIDMESGAVHEVAQAWGKPLYVIRTLSDLAGEESHLTYPEMAAMAAANSALCVIELLDIFEEERKIK
ncbi:5'-methylthioadenosine/S-adenosylhomocysteine nucleosidase [Phenylobacterium sp.]|jgi:adenosylhomocysteine nucleosidase|uniref:5'-methylthioadenosine/S-adenosylhomocysteine nucleosidase n=1 Tax=Phenylobacterium sp. TaxID=1871053 RepID=UPI002F949F1E